MTSMARNRCAHPNRTDITAFGLWSHDFSLVTGQAFVTARAAALMRRGRLSEFVYHGPGVSMLVTWLRCTFGLWSAVWRGRVDTLYMVCSRSTVGFIRDIPAYLVAILGVRVIVHVHGSDIVDLVHRRGVGALARRMLRSCEVIVPSSHLVEPLRRAGIRNVHVCENFVVEPEPGSATGGWSAPPTLGGATLTVLWNSNILATKGFFVTAEAVDSLYRDGRRIRLIVLGSPMPDSELSSEQVQNALQALGDRPWLDLRGSVNRETSAQVLNEADVVCLPSWYSSECQPLAVIEAMCAGRHLVVSNSPALVATVGDYPCEVTGSIDVRSVASALSRLSPSHPGKSVLERGAAAARARFSADRFDRVLTSILESAPIAASPR